MEGLVQIVSNGRCIPKAGGQVVPFRGRQEILGFFDQLLRHIFPTDDHIA